MFKAKKWDNQCRFRFKFALQKESLGNLQQTETSVITKRTLSLLIFWIHFTPGRIVSANVMINNRRICTNLKKIFKIIYQQQRVGRVLYFV